MRLSFLIFSLTWHRILQLALGIDDITLTRQADGDVFNIPGSCNEACMVLSSNTASPSGFALPGHINGINDSCMCQCNNGLPVFREDLQICVNDIQECDVTGFISSSGLVEKVPYVYLPQYGQIIYPRAEILFDGVESPVCIVTGVQQLGRGGWSELRNTSNVEFPLSLYRDEKRTFLRWMGDGKLHKTAEGKIVVVKLACRDSHPGAVYPGIFTPCVAFRVSGSPSKSSIKEVSFATSSPSSEGLTSAEYTAIGISSVLLALIYVASVALYLHSRKSRQKTTKEQSEPENGRLGCVADLEPSGLVKCNPLLSASRHFESDTNSAVSESDVPDKLLPSESESDLENITSALIHPHEEYVEPQEHSSNSGSIISERLPEEDVRVIETTENVSHQTMPVFPGTQRRKLYFNPAYFERQLLLAPPPAAVEFLLKIREVISIARHKMSAKRFVPTLNEIPEESHSERQSPSAGKAGRKRGSSVQNGKSLRCTGCPGCNHGSASAKVTNTRGLVESTGGPISGESRVRAWLEDVKLLDARWRNLEEERTLAVQKHHQQQQTKPQRDVDTESTRMSTKSLPPIFKELSEKRLQSGCVNEIYVNEEREHRIKRSAQSVTREPGLLDRQANEEAVWSRRLAREHQENAANAKIRRTIENSFKKQLEQLQTIQTENQKLIQNESTSKSDNRIALLPNPEHHRVDKKQTVVDKSASVKVKNIAETRALLNIINGELSSRSCSEAKRIMDAVIQELVVAKEKEKEKEKVKDKTEEKEKESIGRISDYETDSLEKVKVSRKSSSSPVSTDKSSPALSTALPMDEEMTMRNAIIDVQISETMTTKTSTIVKNHNLPEVVPLRPENYALVSEVYVNDGYTSPTSDDDSGPEIQYEPDNPGHLTIKLVDSPKNYVKQDESEYEPDTLDRKPLKLKINGDITYEKEIANEVYVDSLERSSQILLKSKESFKDGDDGEARSQPSCEYNSLREIYEARLKYQQQQQQQHHQYQHQHTQSINEKDNIRSDSWLSKSCNNCTSPLLSRHKRRQRKAENQPDVVPKPPPPPPPIPESTEHLVEKNAQDRSLARTGDPTTCEDTPVVKKSAPPVVGKPPTSTRKSSVSGSAIHKTKEKDSIAIEKQDEKRKDVSDIRNPESMDLNESKNIEDERRNEKRQQYRRFSKWRSNSSSEGIDKSHRKAQRSRSRSRSCQKSAEAAAAAAAAGSGNLEDSAYVSSPESNGSRRRLLLDRESCTKSTSSSCTESDESTSGNGGANSESGAESIETDSVFFGNFRSDRHCQRQTHNEPNDQQQRPINYRAFQIKSRVY